MRQKRTNIYNNFIFKRLISPIIGRPGQMLMEYALIIVVVVAAFILTMLYLQRSLQGRYKAAADYSVGVLSKAQGLGNSVQYDPYYDDIIDETNRVSQMISSYDNGQSTKAIDFDINSRRGASIVPPYREAGSTIPPSPF